MNDLRLDGWVYNTESSHRNKAYLRVTPSGEVWFAVADASQEQEIGPIPIADCSISDRLGSTPRFIAHASFGRFETQENDLVDSAVEHFIEQGQLHLGVVSRLAHQLESNLRTVLATVLISIVCVVGFVRYGIPWSMTIIADTLPESVARSVGEGGFEILDATVFETSAFTDQEKTALRERLESVLSDEERAMSTLVFRSSERLGANAFALPDGTVIFTDDLVNLAERDEELQGILFHEIGHIRARHSLRSLLQQSSTGLIVLLITGDVNAASQAAILLPTVLLEAHYSREMEIEADQYAIKRMRESGFSAQYLGDILSRLHEPMIVGGEELHRHDIPTWLSTHPHVEERLQLLQD